MGQPVLLSAPVLSHAEQLPTEHSALSISTTVPTQAPQASQRHVLTLDALRRLVALLSSRNRSVAEVAARVLASGCSNAEQVPLLGCFLPLFQTLHFGSADTYTCGREACLRWSVATLRLFGLRDTHLESMWCSKGLWRRRGGLERLVELLRNEEAPRQEAALAALAALTADSRALQQQLAASGSAFPGLCVSCGIPSEGCASCTCASSACMLDAEGHPNQTCLATQ